MILLTFAVPGELPDWEAIMRIGPLGFNRVKKSFERTILGAALTSSDFRPTDAVMQLMTPGTPLAVNIFWADPGHKRPIDPDNQAVAVKLILDAIKGKLIHNDRRWRSGEGGMIARIVHNFAHDNCGPDDACVVQIERLNR